MNKSPQYNQQIEPKQCKSEARKNRMNPKQESEISHL